MSIDEAIAHAKEQSEIFGGTHGEFLTNISSWLEELKALKTENAELHCEIQAINATMGLYEEEIKNKTIVEFVKKINNKITVFVLEHQKQLDFVSGVSMGWRFVDDVAEEMGCPR